MCVLTQHLACIGVAASWHAVVLRSHRPPEEQRRHHSLARRRHPCWVCLRTLGFTCPPPHPLPLVPRSATTARSRSSAGTASWRRRSTPRRPRRTAPPCSAGRLSGWTTGRASRLEVRACVRRRRVWGTAGVGVWGGGGLWHEWWWRAVVEESGRVAACWGVAALPACLHPSAELRQSHVPPPFPVPRPPALPAVAAKATAHAEVAGLALLSYPLLQPAPPPPKQKAGAAPPADSGAPGWPTRQPASVPARCWACCAPNRSHQLAGRQACMPVLSPNPLPHRPPPSTSFLPLPAVGALSKLGECPPHPPPVFFLCGEFDRLCPGDKLQETVAEALPGCDVRAVVLEVRSVVYQLIESNRSNRSTRISHVFKHPREPAAVHGTSPRSPPCCP